MLIDRDDQVINLCEMKYAQGEYELPEAYDKSLRNKLSVFVAHSGTKKRCIPIDAYILWSQTKPMGKQHPQSTDHG